MRKVTFGLFIYLLVSFHTSCDRLRTSSSHRLLFLSLGQWWRDSFLTFHNKVVNLSNKYLIMEVFRLKCLFRAWFWVMDCLRYGWFWIF